MAADRVERRLSAIFVADVAGYSRLMGADEEGTHARLNEHLGELIYAEIGEYGGRIIRSAGDGILVEFASVVNAMRCAVAIQRGMITRNTDVPSEKRIEFRIGINAGDIIAENGDIFGDGVNVAARLEALCEPGGVCVSQRVREDVQDKLSVVFEDSGEHHLKNIARPVRVYRVRLDAAVRPPQFQNGVAAPTPRSAPRLSIVVLPFSNFSGDPEQDYFVDGVTESLTTDLSRISDSFVIARNSAFSYKGKAIDVRQVGRELNVRYVLEGSVQRSGKRIRVNVQLNDAESGKHLWAERFEKPVADLFDMQDEIVSRLANTLSKQLIAVEAWRAERSLNPDALDLIFQGAASVYKGAIPEHMAQARGFFERALAIDHRSVEALVGMALVDLIMGASHLDDRTARCSAAEANVIKALSLVPDHTVAHLVLGIVYIITNRAARGISECEQVLALDRNSAYAHSGIGLAKYYMGRAAETEGHILDALRLSPRDVFAYRWMQFVGAAKIHLGADDEAVAWLRRSIEANRNYPLAHFWLAAALGLRGAADEARTATEAGLALDPSFTIRRLRGAGSSDNPTFLAGLDRVCTGMRVAGVPEG
jgi:TolB-like protein/class 3 adenylate cyclase